MGKLNNFLLNKMATSREKLETAAETYVSKKLSHTTLKQDCKTYLGIWKAKRIMIGKELASQEMKAELLTGLEKDFFGATVDEMLQPYRDEPLFAAVMDRLGITWEELEEVAAKVVK